MELNQILDEKRLSELETKIKETRDRVEKMVREYPLASVAVALGIGFILARFFERSRRS